jgi:hypothetical protein
MLVKEEKILLMAKEGEDVNEILNAVKQVVNNCILEENFNVEKLAIFDIEYLFIKLRSVSVNNKTKIIIKDAEEIIEEEIDLDKVIVKFDDTAKNQIEIEKDLILVLKYPESSLFSNKELLEKETWNYEDLTLNCIEKIYHKDEVYTVENESKEDLHEFLDNIPLTPFNQIKEFFDRLPTVYYKVEYKNKEGIERSVELTALNDFFTL